MRVIAGIAKGRVLFGPKTDRIRPAIDKVKGAIFNILGDIVGLKVLDLFAGTGSIGIEALSRGAAHCTFVDASRDAVKLILKNLKKTGFEKQSHVVRINLRRPFHPSPPTFHLIFVDPPYDQNLVNPTLRAIVREKLLAAGGIVVVEHSPRESLADDLELTVYDKRKYGQTLVSFLKGPPEPFSP